VRPRRLDQASIELEWRHARFRARLVRQFQKLLLGLLIEKWGVLPF